MLGPEPVQQSRKQFIALRWTPHSGSVASRATPAGSTAAPSAMVSGPQRLGWRAEKGKIVVRRYSSGNLPHAHMNTSDDDAGSLLAASEAAMLVGVVKEVKESSKVK